MLQISDLQRALDAALRDIASGVSIVFTDVPSSDSYIIDFLDAAVSAACRHGKSLAEIELPMARYPAMGAHFWHVPVVDSGNRDIVRLNYEPGVLAAA